MVEIGTDIHRRINNWTNTLSRRLLDIFYSKNIDLVVLAQGYRNRNCLRLSYFEALSKLVRMPLIHMDIGARGGEEKLVEKYQRWFASILVEPVPEPAKAARSDSPIIIDKLMGANECRSALNVTREPALSSVLQPSREAVSYFSPNPDQYDVIDSIELPMTSISATLKEKGIDHLEYLKVDTQGTELNVLKGLEEYAPLIIKTEISFMPLYQDSCLFWEISRFLTRRGYIMFDLIYHSPAPPRRLVGKRGSFTRIPMHGDAFFMPDWTDEMGRKMIYHRDREFAALLLMFGLEENLKYILGGIATPNRKEILSAISRR